MSLLTDLIFVKALRSNSELIGQLPAGDVYNTTIALPDTDFDNAPVPYIIVSFDGMQNDDYTKDNDFEGDTDHVQVSIEVAAQTRPKVGELLTAVRETVRDYFIAHQGDNSDEDFALIPNSAKPSADRMTYDPDKPCYWQVLTYQCETEI